MNLLDRYVLRTMLGAVLMVCGVLAVLGVLFTFINEQSDIGIGRYGTFEALVFALESVPQFVLQTLPVGALMGAMLGIGVLARSQELTVMRAGGMSKWRLALTMLMGGAIMVAFALLVGELLAPRMQQMATEGKAFAKFDKVSFAGSSGAWLRDGNLIINVQQRISPDQYDGMLVFSLDAGQRLGSVGRAERASSSDSGEWQLSGYRQSDFNGESVGSREFDHYRLASRVGEQFLRIAAAQPADLSLGSLYGAIRYRSGNGLESQSYRFAFWTRVARTAALLFGMLFALPFGFGSLRSAGAGARTTIGLGIGIIYFLLQRMVEGGAIALALNPVLLAWLPAAALLVATVVVLVRAR